MLASMAYVEEEAAAAPSSPVAAPTADDHPTPFFPYSGGLRRGWLGEARRPDSRDCD